MSLEKTSVDQYVNMLVQTITMSAANTLTFSEINIGLNLFDKVGLLVNRIEYHPTLATLQDIDTDGDSISIGLTTNNTLASLNPSNAAVIDLQQLHRVDAGAAANAILVQTPLIHDFSTLRGGGMLIAPKPLYIAMMSAGLTAAGVAYFRLYFSLVQLSDAGYLELLQTRGVFA